MWKRTRRNSLRLSPLFKCFGRYVLLFLIMPTNLWGVSPKTRKKEKEMSIEELEKRERDAYEAFMEADWMHADMRLNEWLDAAHELNEAKGL